MGCLVDVPDAPAPRPLVVVLHGDEGSPKKVFDAWRPVTRARGFVLFAPKCPKDQGCSAGSWWRWQGDPAWLFAEVDALGAEAGVDPRRRFVAGWSGGTSYLGMFAERWGERFAAVSMAGGGVPARGVRCEACPRPVRYLMGDQNPLFALAEETRAELELCRHAVDWRLLPGRDHGGEWRAYATASELDATLSFFLAHPMSDCTLAPASSSSAAPTASAEPSVAPTASTFASTPLVAPQPHVASPGDTIAPPRRGGCACAFDAPAATWDPRGLAGLAVLIAALRPVGSRRRRAPRRVAVPGQDHAYK